MRNSYSYLLTFFFLLAHVLLAHTTQAQAYYSVPPQLTSRSGDLRVSDSPVLQYMYSTFYIVTTGKRIQYTDRRRDARGTIFILYDEGMRINDSYSTTIIVIINIIIP